MNKAQAEKEAQEWNTQDGIWAKVVRILPEYIDPIIDGDNGWDIQITYLASKFDDDVAHESFRGWR